MRILSTVIEKPNDQIIEVLINKYFSDHQISITTDVIKYLSGRVIRSYSDLSDMLIKINNLSLKNKQKITITAITGSLNKVFNITFAVFLPTPGSFSRFSSVPGILPLYSSIKILA